MKIDIQKYWGDRELYHVGELISKIIHSMQTDGTVYLYTKEGKNGHYNGMFELLDQLCSYWGWDKSAITIENANRWHTHPEYNIVFTEFSHPAANFDTTSSILPWNGEKYYGMFIGRANASRIYAAHKHDKFKYKHHGLTSFNDNIFEYMCYPELVDYFFHSGQTYSEMCSIKPYSDIGPVMTPPIVPPYNSNNWSEVYKKIAIEIACETSTQPQCTDISEKVFRPMYYKRPFLLIGSPGQLEFMRSIGYKTFNGIIPEDYDHLEGFQRVDRVFEILEQMIATKTIDTLLSQCNDVLEYNHNWFISESNRQKQQYKDINEQK